MKAGQDKRHDPRNVHISVSRDDLAALAARAKSFRDGSRSTALLEMAEAHRRDRAMNALLAVLAKIRPRVEDAEPHVERRAAGRRKSPRAKDERGSGRKHTRWTDDD